MAGRKPKTLVMCTICGQGFKSWSKLRAHIRKKHLFPKKLRG